MYGKAVTMATNAYLLSSVNGLSIKIIFSIRLHSTYETYLQIMKSISFVHVTLKLFKFLSFCPQDIFFQTET